MRLLLIGCLLLGSCSLLFSKLSDVSCDNSFVVRCDGDALIVCERGFELSIDCHEGRCNAEEQRCGVCGDGLVDTSFEDCEDLNADDTDECPSTCQLASCGDGFLRADITDPGDPAFERCDEGEENGDLPGHCRATCMLPFCGDGIVDPGESCDGNFPCTPLCGFCGNGALDLGEQCDDGNFSDGDTCESNCTIASCGNSIVDVALGELCDDGNANADACTDLCVPTSGFCGDGLVSGAEQCDDGRQCSDGADCLSAADCVNGQGCFTRSNDGCNAECVLEVCGDGIVHPGEQCDDGNSEGGDGCSVSCTIELCGNGIVDANEECDDQNISSGDLCNGDCSLPTCGDGVTNFESGEQCDDGNVLNGDSCTSSCQLPLCGDGAINALEQCDDGNLVSGDGCNANCTLPSCHNGVVDPGELCYDAAVLAVPAGTAIGLADMNNDGDLDVVSASGSEAFTSDIFTPAWVTHLGASGKTFSAPIFGSSAFGFAPGGLADFTGDGLLDFVMIQLVGNNATLFSGDGAGVFSFLDAPFIVFQPFRGIFTDLEIADLNGDSTPDVAIPDLRSGLLDILFNDGVGGFSSTVQLSPGGAPRSIVPADLNADGDQDLVVGLHDAVSNTGQLSVLLGEGSGSFSAPVVLPLGEDVLDLISADLNSDGDLDVIAAVAGPDSLQIFLGNGDGSFEAPVVLTGGAQLSHVVAADLDGDADLDLAALSVLGVQIFRNNGGFSLVDTVSASVALQTLFAGDLDGDLRPELVSSSPGTGLTGGLIILSQGR